MYEDLFAELDLELMKATKGIKKLDLKLNTTKKQMNIVSKQEQLPKTYKHIEKQSPSFPFAKSLRFNPKKDQALDETQLSFASFSTNPSLDSIKTKGPAIVFSKSDRFVSETSNLEEEAKELNPNYEITKKKAAVLVVYKQPTNKPKSLFNKKEIESIVESVDNEPGPGDYELKFNLIERKVNGGNFYRADRFKKDENDEMQEDINPNYDIVK